MTKLVVDSGAWLEVLRGTEAGAKIKEQMKNSDIFITSTSVYMLLKDINSKEIVEAVIQNSTVIDIDLRIAEKAAELYAGMQDKDATALSMLEVAAARLTDAQLLTTDKKLEGMEGVVVV